MALGGAGVSNTTASISGNVGGSTSFGSYLTAQGGDKGYSGNTYNLGTTLKFGVSGGITIPATGGTYCSYWENTGGGWSHITTATIPTSLSTNKYSSLRIYGRTLTATEITTIYDYELVTHHIPVDNGLIAYYPLETNSMDNYFNQYDGTDTAVTYDGTSYNYNKFNISNSNWVYKWVCYT